VVSRQLDIEWQFFAKASDVLVKPWEACALLLYIDPDTMNEARTDYSVGPGVAAMYGEQSSKEKLAALEEFNRYCKRLGRYIDDPRFFTLVNGKLRLIEFLHWARKMEIEVIPFHLLMLDPTQEEAALLEDRFAWSDGNEPLVRRCFTYLLDPARLSAATGVPNPTDSALLKSPAEPAAGGSATTVAVKPKRIRPKTKHQQMLADFRRVLVEHGYNPDALPPEKRGNGDSGLRSLVAEALSISSGESKSFERHWERAFEKDELSWADKSK
jgi:hypothetical protein